MKRHLFLTGPMGCGKSTAIERALGEKLPSCGGFRTVRTRDSQCRAVSFSLESADGKVKETFLDFSSEEPVVHMDVFSAVGVSLLRGKYLLLDEIGGMELLCPEFTSALYALLKSDIPILGVMKGEGPAGALIQALGLSAEYETAARRLRNDLRQDENTIVYDCGQFDENALRLAENWVKEYVHE